MHQHFLTIFENVEYFEALLEILTFITQKISEFPKIIKQKYHFGSITYHLIYII